MRIARVVGWFVVIGGALVAVVAFLGSRAPGSSSTSAVAFAVASLAVSVGAFWLLRRTASPSVPPLLAGIPDDMYASGGKTDRVDSDPAREGRAKPIDDPFRDLPFEMLLPVGWQAGLADGTSAEGLEMASGAVFLAHDPETWDSSGYMATVAVFVSEPVEDADAYLSEAEREFRSGAEADASVSAFELSRVSLRAGEALRYSFTRDALQVQYYLPTLTAVIELWFTAPTADRYRGEAASEVMAQSFRWKDE